MKFLTMVMANAAAVAEFNGNGASNGDSTLWIYALAIVAVIAAIVIICLFAFKSKKSSDGDVDEAFSEEEKVAKEQNASQKKNLSVVVPDEENIEWSSSDKNYEFEEKDKDDFSFDETFSSETPKKEKEILEFAEGDVITVNQESLQVAVCKGDVVFASDVANSTTFKKISISDVSACVNKEKRMFGTRLGTDCFVLLKEDRLMVFGKENQEIIKMKILRNNVESSKNSFDVPLGTEIACREKIGKYFTYCPETCELVLKDKTNNKLFIETLSNLAGYYSGTSKTLIKVTLNKEDFIVVLDNKSIRAKIYDSNGVSCGIQL